MKPIRLGVNVDHVATLRQARGTRYPDPVVAAALAESAGAEQITVHLREDRRHIQDRDVHALRGAVSTLLNLEMAASPEMVAIALEVQPDIVTLVPERREERTTEGGLSVHGAGPELRDAIAALSDADIEVSLFVDPHPRELRATLDAGARTVELHTGDYCLARGAARDAELARLVEGARFAHDLGMRVAAGHGLDAHNVGPVAAIAPITELNIGHSLISRAVFVGLDAAIAELLDAIAEARR